MTALTLRAVFFLQKNNTRNVFPLRVLRPDETVFHILNGTPSVFFSGKYKKSTRPLISSSKPVVCGSVSEIYLSLRVSRSSPKIKSSISGRSGCWGIISFLILLSPPSLYSMLYYSTIFPDCKLNFCKLTTIKQKTDARSCIRSIYKA